MSRLPRWLIFAVILGLLAVGGGVSLAVGTVRRSFPQLDGRVTLAGLTGSVEVLRDGYGVPQVYADNAEDLFAAQGFVAASDRFYEMDLRRHIAAGRLSELFGADQVETDTYIRTLGWRRTAERELLALSPSTRRYLDAYAWGVNTYLRGRAPADLSLEYSLLGWQGLDYVPENWTAVDSLGWIKAMAWELSNNLAQESELAAMTAKVGARRANQLFPPYPYDNYAPIVGGGSLTSGRFRAAGGAAGARPRPAALTREQLRRGDHALRSVGRLGETLAPVLGPANPGETGSNSWAVAGSRTATGQAMLSNDPHLATAIPSTFAQVGLHCRQVTPGCPFDVTGFSLAGVPGVTIGKTTTIAWGLTTAYADTADLYLEDIRGETVRDGRRYTPLTRRTEEIRVRGEDVPRTITVRSTRHGPLLSDVDPGVREAVTTGPGPVYGVSLSWTGNRPGRSMDALFAINAATTFGQFRAAAKLLSAPVQNLMYADTAGNIGYQLPGDIPRRGKGDGGTPAPGWDRSYDWRGSIPFAELPYAYNPPSGFLVAANQPIVGHGYPYRLGSDYSYGWRSQQIRDRLKQAAPLTLDRAESLFYDDTVRVAAAVVPTLLRVKVSDPWVVEGQRSLVGWDYTSPASSGAAAYFAVVMHNVWKLTFRDEMPETWWPAGGDRWYAVLAGLIKKPRDRWWDDTTTPDRVETRDDILVAAMTQARKEITSLMARDPDRWQWGRVHFVTLRNETLGSRGPGIVQRLFNRGHYPVGGGPAVVNAMSYDDRRGYAVTHGPTMRMLVDLGDLDRSRWVNQSGVSGHAFSQYYDDQTELWATGRTWPFVSSRSAIEAGTAHRLELVPNG